MKKQFLFSATFLILFYHTTVRATTIQSDKTGNWNTTSTWVGNVIPANDDDVIITVGHDVTIDENGGSNSCKSLTINGKLIYNNSANFSVGNFNNRTSAMLVNGIFEYSVGYSFKIYGYLKFNTGSTFKMTSGGLTIDGALSAGTSVAAGQALLDVSDIGTLNVFRSTITFRNPHYDASTPCIKGAKRFGNTIAFGNGNMTDLNNDFIVSETEKPQFSFVEVNILGSASRFKATNIVIDSAVSIIAGTFYNYSSATPIYVKGDFNANQGVTITGNIEFNGSSQQNINPQYLSGATSLIFNGDIIVNNPTEVKSKINVTIQGGDLKFIQGRFDVEQKTLMLERTPINTSSSSYIITYNFYLDKGYLLIQNLAGNTLFPVGTHYSYTPIWVNASSGSFKASLTPYNPLSVPTSSEYVNLKWDIERTAGSASANIVFQWNSSDEVGNFSTIRNYCRIFNYNGSAWNSITPTTGVDNTIGTIHTKTATNVSSFTSFAIFSNVVLPIEISHFTGQKHGNRALLAWATLSEKDNHGFDIQKMTEGGYAFETIGFVKSQGDLKGLADYVFWDDNFNKTTYYRLKQRNRDGSETFSKIISLENKAEKNAISVFPNPILRGGLLTMKSSDSVVSDNFMVTVFNANGQQVGQQKGLNPLETSAWQNGIYFVKIIKNTEVSSFKVFIHD